MTDSNLNQIHPPIFAPIFGEQWEALPPVMKKHYANRPYSRDTVIVEGRLSVEHHGVLRLLRPFYRLLGNIPMVNVQDIPVRVQFDSDPDSRAFHFRRTFSFPDVRPYHFHSRMLQIEDNKLVEIMRFGICWCLSYHWEDNKVLLRHRGYALHWFGHVIPLPLYWLLGRGDAEEVPLDDDRFAMQVTMMHPWFGQLYSYRGEFRVVQAA